MNNCENLSVALLGRAGAGKDTVAELLAGWHGHARVAFADPLKEMALAVDPIIYASSWDEYGETEEVRLSYAVGRYGWDTAKRDYPEVRRFLQKLGAEGVRETIGLNTWIHLAEQKISEYNADGRPVVITDVRFPNEVALARRLGFRLLWISRPGVEDGKHSSESSVGPSDADAIVVNDGTKEDLASRVSRAIDRSA